MHVRHSPALARASLALLAATVGACGGERPRPALQVATPATRPPDDQAQLRCGGTSYEHDDDFLSGGLLAGYDVSAPPPITVTSALGVLRMASTSPATFADGHVVLKETLEVPIAVRARIRLGEVEGHEGSVARIQLVRGDTWLNLGMSSPTGVTFQEQRRGRGTLTETAVPGLTLDHAWHTYEILYDGGVASLYCDDHPVGRVHIDLYRTRVWLQVHTSFRKAGAVLGEFKDLNVKATDALREPESTSAARGAASSSIGPRVDGTMDPSPTPIPGTGLP